MARSLHSIVRAALVAVLVLALAIPALGSSPEASVLIVWTSGNTPFEEAWSGLRTGFGTEAIDSVDLTAAGAIGDLEAALRRQPRLIVAIGTAALSALRTYHGLAPVLATMVLRADTAAILAGSAQKLSAVYLDVPPGEVMIRLRALFPGKTRLGVIRNPSRDAATDGSQARQLNFTIESRDCPGPDTLLKTLRSFMRKADFVLLQPDASLYNEATARPLLMASLEEQLPVVGFSASFVRAGAAVGVYPDFRDIGAQTADAARRYLNSNATLPSESPRKLVFAANQSVLRLLGLEYKRTDEYPVTVIK